MLQPISRYSSSWYSRMVGVFIWLLLGAVGVHCGKSGRMWRGDEPLYNKGLFEGDIVGISPIYSNETRTATTNPRHLWPNGIIYYELHSSLSGYEYIVDKGMNQYHKDTCLRFVHKNYMPAGNKNYIQIRADYEGCWSMVGMMGGMQVVSLSWNGCLWHGLVLHELGHAVGFFHEHNRPDRDSHINIWWDNILSGLEYAFYRRTTQEAQYLGQAYDFKSMMHYETTAFSGNGRETMTAKNPSITAEDIGYVWKKNFSKSDILKINRLYRCPGYENWDKQ